MQLVGDNQEYKANQMLKNERKSPRSSSVNDGAPATFQRWAI